jgi:hypothetical protein
VTVPVLVGETLGRDVFAYKLTVRFDPALVRFVDATSVAIDDRTRAGTA